MKGWKDSPLTGKGIKQARQLSQRLSDVPLNAIYSSTSDRAVNTAEIINKESPEEWLSFWETPHLFSNATVEPLLKCKKEWLKQ